MSDVGLLQQIMRALGEKSARRRDMMEPGYGERPDFPSLNGARPAQMEQDLGGNTALAALALGNPATAPIGMRYMGRAMGQDRLDMQQLQGQHPAQREQQHWQGLLQRAMAGDYDQKPDAY